MSIVVDRDTLTSQQAHDIAKQLILIPKKVFMPGRKSFTQPVDSGTPLYYKNGNKVHLPYTFAKCYLGVDAPERPQLHMPFKAVLRENQIPKAAEALEHLRQNGTCTLQLDTAYGKTYISAYLASQLGRLTLVLHDMKILHGQWIKTFNDAVECCIWDIHKKPPPMISVIVCSTGLIDHIPEEILSQVGTLIMDESHTLCTPSCIPAILKVQPQYIIASSYTYERTDGCHMFMDAVVGLHRVHGKLDVSITAITCYTGLSYPSIPTNKNGTDWSQLMNMVCDNADRNTFICDLVQRNLHRKIILLTPRVNHAKELCAMLVERGIKADYITGTKPKYENGNVLVGSIGKINTGFDEKNYCSSFDGIPSNMLINVGSNKEPNLIIQIAGRLKRTNNTILVDVVDDLAIMKRHAKSRNKIYIQEGYTVMDVKGLFTVPQHE